MSFYEELLDTKRDDQSDQSEIIPGILVGEVVENWDEEHPGMVKIQLPLGADEKNDIGWVPVSVPYAGSEYGSYLLPEIGAHVLLAFHMGRLESPYVIGCVYNQTNVIPGETAKENNPTKMLLTKGGNRIIISDEEEKEKITIQTKGGLSIILEDENQKIMAADSAGDNSIVMDAKEGTLTLNAKSKVSIKVNGNEMLKLDGDNTKVLVKTDQIAVEAAQKLTLKGQNVGIEGNTEIKGQSVKVEAQTSLGLKGTGSLKAESSGITELKGSMVKVN